MSESEPKTFTQDFGEGGESPGLWCSVSMTGDPDGLKVKWVLHQVESYGEEGEPTMEQPEIASGYFKWDGCAEMTCDLHTCSASQWYSVWRIISILRDLAQEHFDVPSKESRP